MVTATATVERRAIKSRAGRAVNKAGVVPRHGPYATVKHDGEKWVVTLNEAGRELVARTLAKYPQVANLAAGKSPALMVAVELVRARDQSIGEEIEAAAVAGVCQAATYYDPSATTGSFESFAGFHVRAMVTRELEKFNAWMDHARPLPGLGRSVKEEDETPATEPAPPRSLPPGIGNVEPRLLTALDVAFGLSSGVPRPPRTDAGRAELQRALAAARRAVEAKL